MKIFAICTLVIKSFLLGLIRLYQYFISPLIGDVCRFTPSCSNYAALALKKHGVVKGMWLTCKRLLKCNPFFKGGHDEV